MTNKEKLTKIIEKEGKEGFYLLDIIKPYHIEHWGCIDFFLKDNNIGILTTYKPFLKSFFGKEKQKDLELKVYYGEYEWQYHAQKLVLEDNKIDYLYKFINEEKN